MAQLITLITTTNPIPSIPDIHHLYNSQRSLFQIPALALCKKIIVFDGIQPSYENRADDYLQYKNRIAALLQSDPYFADTQLVFCDKWEHLSGAIREAMKHVTTPYVFIHQHDFQLNKTFDLNALVASMEINRNIKHVRFTRGKTNLQFTTKRYQQYDSPVSKKVKGKTFIPLCRVCGWSDNDHLARSDYYSNFVLPKCGHGAMETYLHPALKQSIQKQGVEKGHAPFGTYLYGTLQDGGYFYHSDGRQCWEADDDAGT